MLQQDLQALLDKVRGIAEKMLSDRKALEVFGATMTTSGEIGLAYPDPSCASAPGGTVGQMFVTFNQFAKASHIRAAVLCVPVPPGGLPKSEFTHAVAFNLEHQNGDSFAVVVPYKKRLFGGIKYGPPSQFKDKQRVFAGC
jgi:hypothetical protein